MNMMSQSMCPNDDYFSYGLLRARFNGQLRRDDGDVDVIHRYCPGHVPPTQFPGNRTVFFGDTVFDVGVYKNLYTVIPLTKWTDNKKGLDMLTTLVKYIILTIHQEVPPSVANAMGVKVYLYAEDRVSVPGFEEVIQRDDTILCYHLASPRHEYVSVLMFDNNYNTPFIKCHDLENFATPSWEENLQPRTVGVSFSPRGFNFDPILKLA